MKVFRILDKDNKGLINDEDLRQGLLSFGMCIIDSVPSTLRLFKYNV